MPALVSCPSTLGDPGEVPWQGLDVQPGLCSGQTFPVPGAVAFICTAIGTPSPCPLSCMTLGQSSHLNLGPPTRTSHGALWRPICSHAFRDLLSALCRVWQARAEGPSLACEGLPFAEKDCQGDWASGQLTSRPGRPSPEAGGWGRPAESRALGGWVDCLLGVCGSGRADQC